MLDMLWPVMIVVLSNVFYNICQKSTPEGVHPFGTLMVTYVVAAIVTGIIFVCTAGLRNIPSELHKLNWTSFILGIAIVGLELGYIFLYRAGWKVSVGPLVCNIALAVVLIFVGALLYKEKITLTQVMGMILCSGGLILLTK